MEKSYPTQSTLGNFESASLRRLELILARNQTRLLIGLIVLAIAVKTLYVTQIANSPLYQQHLAVNTDMDFFESWAHQVASGDVLSRGVRPPIHNWHIDVAVAYEESKVGELPNLTIQERTEIATRHWTRWCPPEKFYQEPLYPYMLALIYSVFGDGKLLVFAMQSLIGVTSVIILFRSTAMMFGNLIAFISAAMAIGSPPIVMYDAVLLRENFIIFLTSCLIYSLSISIYTNRWWPTGAMVGFACLVKTHFILVLVAAVVLCVCRRAQLSLKLKAVLGLIACFVLTSLPIAIRNAAVGTPLFSSPTGAFFGFIGANVPDYPGFGFFQSPTYSPTLINDSEGSMARSVVLTIGTHEDLLSFAASVSSRVLTSLSWYEAPNNTSSYFYELHSSVLRMLPFRFSVVAPLCAIGILVSLRKPKSALPFLILILVNWSVLILFFVIDRYRAPMLLAMIPLAAVGIAYALDQLLTRRWRQFASSAMVFGLTLCIVYYPLSFYPRRVRAADARWAFQTTYATQFNSLMAAGNLSGASEQLDRFLLIVPNEVEAILAGNAPREEYDRNLLAFYSELYLQGADLHRETNSLEPRNAICLITVRFSQALSRV